MKSRLEQDYKIKLIELRKLINSWELIPDCPDDEFDSINHLLLSQLYKGADKHNTTKALLHEISVNYGIDISMADIKTKIDEVFEYWSNST